MFLFSIAFLRQYVPYMTNYICTFIKRIKIIRKQTFGFIGRLCKSCNTIVQTLENAWIIRIQLWHTWFEVLYTNR